MGEEGGRAPYLKHPSKVAVSSCRHPLLQPEAQGTRGRQARRPPGEKPQLARPGNQGDPTQLGYSGALSAALDVYLASLRPHKMEAVRAGQIRWHWGHGSVSPWSKEMSQQREVSPCYVCALHVCTQLCVSSELGSICISLGVHALDHVPMRGHLGLHMRLREITEASPGYYSGALVPVGSWRFRSAAVYVYVCKQRGSAHLWEPGAQGWVKADGSQPHVSTGLRALIQSRVAPELAGAPVPSE